MCTAWQRGNRCPAIHWFSNSELNADKVWWTVSCNLHCVWRRAYPDALWFCHRWMQSILELTKSYVNSSCFHRNADNLPREHPLCCIHRSSDSGRTALCNAVSSVVDQQVVSKKPHSVNISWRLSSSSINTYIVFSIFSTKNNTYSSFFDVVYPAASSSHSLQPTFWIVFHVSVAVFWCHSL